MSDFYNKKPARCPGGATRGLGIQIPESYSATFMTPFMMAQCPG